jgi:hypothetical protein
MVRLGVKTISGDGSPERTAILIESCMMIFLSHDKHLPGFLQRVGRVTPPFLLHLSSKPMGRNTDCPGRLACARPAPFLTFGFLRARSSRSVQVHRFLNQFSEAGSLGSCQNCGGRKSFKNREVPFVRNGESKPREVQEHAAAQGLPMAIQSDALLGS